MKQSLNQTLLPQPRDSLRNNPPQPAETYSKTPPVVVLPETGFLPIRNFVNIPNNQIGAIPVAQSTFLHWVAIGFAPKPHKWGKRVTVWRVEDLRAFAEKLSAGAASGGADL